MDLGTIIGGCGLDLFAGQADAGDPLLHGRYGGSWPADRVQVPTKGPAGFVTESQLRACVAWSRWLCQRNMLAIGFRDRVKEFVGPVAVQFVRAGQSPGGVSAGPRDADGDGTPDADPLVTAAQQVWDEWCAAADWGRGIEDREAECRERAGEDGEVLLRLGPGGAAGRFLPWVRHVEPEEVRTPAGTAHLPPDVDPADVDWRWGVATSRRDAERVYGYWVCDPDSGGAAGEFVPAAEVVHLKLNCKRTEKRGLPDLLPVEHHLQDVVGIVGNMGGTAREQSGVAWRERHATASEEQVRVLMRQGAEAYTGYSHPGAAGGGPARAGRYPVRTHNGVKVVHVDGNREFEEGPTAAGAESFTKVIDSTLKAVGFRFGVPEWFAGGGADSFASALVTGSPFARAIESRQERAKGFAAALAGRVVALAEASGRLPPGTAAAVRPVCTARPVVIADEEKQARTSIELYKENLADPHEIIKERGGDPKQVAAGIAAWRQKFPAAGAGQGPTPGTPPPRDPTPAPPGSAGGDGTSPGDPFAAEGGVREDRSGLVQRTVTRSDGVQTHVWVKPADAAHISPARASDAPSVPPPLPPAGSVVGRAVARLKALGSAAMETRVGRFLKAAEHRLSIVAHKTREVAAAAAARRRPPLDAEGLARLGRVLAVADFVGGYVTGGVAAVAVHPVAGKVAAFMPSVSALYLAYATVRDPAGVWAAARHVVRATLAGHGVHESSDVTRDLADALASLAGLPDADWREAVFLAALAHGENPFLAVKIAEEAPTAPAEMPTPTAADFGGEVEEQAVTEHGAGLVKKTVRRSDGVETHVWVHPDDAGHVGGTGGQGAADGGTGGHPTPTYPDHPAARAVEDALAHAEHLPAEQRAAYGTAAAGVLSRLPPTALDRMHRHAAGPPHFYPDSKTLGVSLLSGVLQTPNLDDDHAEKYRKMLGQIKQGRLSMGGAVQWPGDGGGGTLHLDGDHVGQKAGTHGGAAETAAEVYAHEFTHLIDGPAYQVSNSKRWTEAFEQEIGPGVKAADGTPRLTRYATTSRAEGLAEFGRLLYGGKVPPEQVEREFPLASKLFREANLWPVK